MSRNDWIAAALLAIAAVGTASVWLDRPGRIEVPAGRHDDGAYRVTPADSSAPIATADGGALLPVAAFEVRGRVLAIERFKPHQSLVNWLPGLRPATHDVGFGFGPMTDSANTERFNFTHEGASNGLRALFARPRGAMTQEEFAALSPFITNVHVIPADDAVYRQLTQIRIGELITLRGTLVNVRRADGVVATTSVTAGDRECEIMRVTEIRVARL